MIRSLACGGFIRVDIVSSRAFRVRIARDERFDEPPLVRYGIVRGEYAPVDARVTEHDAHLSIATLDAVLDVDLRTGCVVLRSAAGDALVEGRGIPRSDEANGFGADFALRDGEKIYGLGDVTRDKIQMRGHRAEMWVRNVASYVPIPFLMSTGGWGLFVNTTWKHVIDLMGDRVHFGGRRGSLDYFLFAGETLPILLDQYTQVAGRPALLPQWAYGLTFVCNQQASAREMLDDCLSFRREGIPCDLIGLEPGWMEKFYDYSIKKRWHPERFYVPPWIEKGENPATFLGAARRLGFKMSLWLCCDYDLLYEEERRLASQSENDESLPAPPRHPDDFEQDQHFGHEPQKMDQLTDRSEGWFEHLKKFIDQGVSAFKMDGANQVNEHPDRKWGQGLARGDMDDAEMHNLYPALLNKQMSDGFSEHTGRRSMIYSSGGYAGIQRYAATWAGDTGGGPRPLVSLLNHGLSGHSNTSVDMDVFTKEGIHFGFFMSWAQVCSWAYWRHPWLLGNELGPIFKYYARLRYRLMPYLYSMAHEAARTGMPMMRALPLAFPADPKGDEFLTHYMLGSSLLTTAFDTSLHLPAGEWVDLWTGEKHAGPREIAYTPPDGRGGPLLAPVGAIIPMAPDVAYWGEKPLETIDLHVVPGAPGSFTLWEDDGETLKYRTGAVASTTIELSGTSSDVRITLGERRGSYDGMPAARSYRVVVHGPDKPSTVLVNGAATDWTWANGGLEIGE